MTPITSSYTTLDGVSVPVTFTKEVVSSGNNEIIVCNHEKYEMRLLKLDIETDPAKNSKIIYNAQLTSKLSNIIIHAPVIQITGGSHAGTIMIGRTASLKKHRALLSHYVSADRIFDEVTMPYSDYMIIETMLKQVCVIE